VPSIKELCFYNHWFRASGYKDTGVRVMAATQSPSSKNGILPNLFLTGESGDKIPI